MTTLAAHPRPSARRGAPLPVVLVDGDGSHGGDVLDTWTTTRADRSWTQAVVERLGLGERAVVALSFVPGGPAVAHRVEPRAASVPPARTPAGTHHHVVAVPDEDAYAASVRAALDRIAAGQLEKVVLGRCLDVVSEPPLDPSGVVARLLADRPGPHVFCVPLGAAPTGGGPAPALLLGASPELLVRRTGREVRSTPLAGSVPRSTDPRVDAERAQSLRESSKDLAEHAFVVEAIRDHLGPLCTDLDVRPVPDLVRTDTMWHLATPIRGRLAGDAPSALALARLLHPTPAVGGVPAPAALAAVDDLEGDLRGYLAGTVGWVDAHGDGAFAVSIRAGVLDGPRLRLFAGAGIVAGSDPASEVRETGAKLGTMARAVGL